MKIVGTTAYLSWEELTEGLVAKRAVLLPEGAKELRLDANALEMAEIYFEGGE